VVALNERARVAQQVSETMPGVAFGMGRSYGDACLNPGGVLWNTAGLDRLMSFDEERGVLTCEAGVLLRDIQRVMLRRGWMLPVSPGTQLITVGGAIANDVHGKNHHVAGSFGDHVRQLTLLRTNGEWIECGPDDEPNWFAATVGGLGLTGVITSAALQLRRVDGPWLDSESIAYQDLEGFFQLADSSESGWEHTVSWIDCVGGVKGRGIFLRANHALGQQRQQRVQKMHNLPITPPRSLVNRVSLLAMNTAYYHLHRLRAGRRLVDYQSFFYPLDSIGEWNRIYGPKGFYQYQSVVPRHVGSDATKAMLQQISQAKSGSFLAVLKTFGDRSSKGMLGFPQPGVTLALDFPNQGAASEQLFARLDSVVREAGGRIYLAKDARSPRDLFESGYPRLAEFLPYRDAGISSAMSRRLIGS
jgi:FAD/FMN-containing dehydrogenase